MRTLFVQLSASRNPRDRVSGKRGKKREIYVCLLVALGHTCAHYLDPKGGVLTPLHCQKAKVVYLGICKLCQSVLLLLLLFFVRISQDVISWLNLKFYFWKLSYTIKEEGIITISDWCFVMVCECRVCSIFLNSYLAIKIMATNPIFQSWLDPPPFYLFCW